VSADASTGSSASSRATPPYSPHTRTALVLTGTGTAGAYHAGVLKALQEAGVKIDLVAGRGIGVVGAAFAAVDGADQLWDRNGLWSRPGVARLYGWRPALRTAVWTLGATLAAVALPLAGVLAAAFVYPLAYLLRVLGFGGDVWLTTGFGQVVDWVFAPPVLPTWLPRLVVLALLVLLAVLTTARARAWMRGGRRRRTRGTFWWDLVGAPIDVLAVRGWFAEGLWKLMRGAASIARPGPGDLGQRYTELLTENLGQPGFRELIVVAHDLDARRDVVFSLLTEPFRRSRAGAEALEAVALSGDGARHAFDGCAAALSLPVATEPWPIRFGGRTAWRGETHRLCDRPEGVGRLLDEVAAAGAGQVILVSALPPPAGPRELAAARRDGRGRLGEVLSTLEAAALRDAVASRAGRFAAVFEIRPSHNPIGPFDFTGAFDARSDRRHTLAELVEQGYDDGHRQFVGPVVGASGEQIEAGRRGRQSRTTPAPRS